MKINELLYESQQLQEGPLLNKIGAGVGKAVGTAAKGVGAVAGGIAGLGSAVKKGYQAGKTTVAGAGDNSGQQRPTTIKQATAQSKANWNAAVGQAKQIQAAKNAGGAAPASASGAAPASAPSGSAAAPSAASGAAPAAAPSGSAAAPAAAPAAASGAGQTAYAQAQQAIAKLQPKQKQALLQFLQKDPKVQAKMTAQKTEPQNAPAAAPAGQQDTTQPTDTPTANTASNKNFDTDTGAPLTPAGKAKIAFDSDPEVKKAMDDLKTKKIDAVQWQATMKKLRTKHGITEKQPASNPNQSEIDADRERIMGVTSDSKIPQGSYIKESFSLFKRK